MRNGAGRTLDVGVSRTGEHFEVHGPPVNSAAFNYRPKSDPHTSHFRLGLRYNIVLFSVLTTRNRRSQRTDELARPENSISKRTCIASKD